jgi:replication-associated recombination protein RarA
MYTASDAEAKAFYECFFALRAIYNQATQAALGATIMLTEQYRPRTWADVVGQDKLVARIQALAKRGLAGRAYWLSGQSGTGKTTIARLLAAEVADDFMVQEVDASTLTLSALAELERQSQVSGFFGAKQVAART